MSKRVNSSIKAACAGLLVGAIMLGTNQAARAADCLTGPNRQPGPGGHWYFHLDHANDRKCWYLVEATGRAPAAETVQPQPPEPQPAFGSFFSSLGLTGAATPDPNTGDPRILQPTRADDARGDDGAPGRQSRIARRPVTEASLTPKPRRPAPARPPAPHADDQAAAPQPDERDALFQEFLKWRQRQ
jgi:hypothetical protein